MQHITFESRASSTRKDRASTLCLLSEYVTKKVSEEGVRKKIKFVVKLILFYMNIRCYITFKKKETNGNRSLVSSVVDRHLSPCATPRFSKNFLKKGYINNSINFESIFLENG